MGNVPTMIDMSLIEKTGIVKLFKQWYKQVNDNGENVGLSDQIRTILRIQDEADAISRYNWIKIPERLKIDSDGIERLLYYKGSLCLFFYNEKLHILPFTGSKIDLLGRYKEITPVPISQDGENTNEKGQKALLASLKLKVFYSVPTDEEIAESGGYKNIAIIIRDYNPQLNPNTILPRFLINDPLLNIESEIFPMARTARLNSTGVRGMKVTSEDESKNVDAANNSLYNAAMSGKAYVPIVGGQDFQDLKGESTTKGEEFMLALQTMENFRLGTYGIANGGLYNKASHELQTEVDLNGGPVEGRLERGLNIRKLACEIANKVFSEIGVSGFDCVISAAAKKENSDPNENKGGDDNENLSNSEQ